MAKIILSTLNARYIHASLGLRYLYANLNDLSQSAKLLEFSINEDRNEIAAHILKHNPKIIGFGVYIWNTRETLELIQLIKSQNPNIELVCGGPEISFYPETHPLVVASDFVIKGEADISFARLCENLLKDEKPPQKVICPALPDVGELKPPYPLYNEDDIANRVIYVEASRGCPFKCEFCLSSLDKKVRHFPLEQFLDDLDMLFKKGVRHFKFVDRTFNLHIETSTKILNFFLERYEPGLFIHFELIPDRLPHALREIIAQFPLGALQFEIGIQTFNRETEIAISRKQDQHKTTENLSYLRQETGVYLHTDLIAGLPGEDLNSFAQGFDRLIALNPHEIQVGILKRLPGTPISRHDATWEMHYNPNPPYDIIENKVLSADAINNLKHFAYFWDRISNSGNFRKTRDLIWGKSSPFWSFLKCSQWLEKYFGRAHSISLEDLVEALLDYLTSVQDLDGSFVGARLLEDYIRIGRKPLKCLKPFIKPGQKRTYQRQWTHPMPRQNRHLVS